MKKYILLIVGFFFTGIIISGCNSMKSENPDPVSFSIFESYHQIHVLANGELFTSYLYDSSLLKPVLFPLYSPSHIRVSRLYPLETIKEESHDHPHHVGMFFTYGSDGEVNGNSFWALQVPPTRIKHIKVTKEDAGQGRAVLETESDWIGKDNNVLLVEDRTMIFTGKDSERAIDFTFNLTARDQDVEFKDTKEGMFAIRVAHWLKEDTGNAMYLNAEGDTTEANIWGKRSKWVRLEGHHDGKVIGIVIFNHPKSVNFPTYWHARAYGLFAANPLGRSVFQKARGVKNPEPMNFTIKAGESALFKFKMIIYEGHKTADEIEKEFYDYSI